MLQESLFTLCELKSTTDNAREMLRIKRSCFERWGVDREIVKHQTNPGNKEQTERQLELLKTGQIMGVLAVRGGLIGYAHIEESQKWNAGTPQGALSRVFFGSVDKVSMSELYVDDVSGDGLSDSAEYLTKSLVERANKFGAVALAKVVISYENYSPLLNNEFEKIDNFVCYGIDVGTYERDSRSKIRAINENQQPIILNRYADAMT